jgi:hypothetical protein
LSRRDAGERGEPVGLRLRRPPIDQAAGADRLAREDQIFKERQIGRKHEFLVDHADAARESVGRTGEANRDIVENDAAFVGRIDTLKNAHQRRFAGAIAANDGVDRPRRHGKVDPVVGDDRAEFARHFTGAESGGDAGPVDHLK